MKKLKRIKRKVFKRTKDLVQAAVKSTIKRNKEKEEVLKSELYKLEQKIRIHEMLKENENERRNVESNFRNC